MIIKSHKIKKTSRNFRVAPVLLRTTLKKFVCQFIPVFWDTNKEHGGAVTPKLCSSPTCLDADQSVSCFDYTHPGLFFQDEKQPANTNTKSPPYRLKIASSQQKQADIFQKRTEKQSFPNLFMAALSVIQPKEYAFLALAVGALFLFL